MKHRFINYVETKLAFAAVLVACLGAGTTYGLYIHVENVRSDTEELVSSNLRARHLVQTLAYVQEAETGQRGYLLTGREEYLQPYVHALGHIDQSLASLQRDYVHADIAKLVVANIDQDTRAKFSELKETIDLRRREGMEAALAVVLQGSGKRLMDAIRADINHLLEDERARIDRSALRQRVAAGRNMELWGWVALMMLLPAALCVLLAFRDARRGRREGARLAHSSTHDELTGLLNRSAILSKFDNALLRRPAEVGLLYLDLDGFKAINDDLGHAVGDMLLIEIAKRLKETLRPADFVARLGGDEFVVLVEECSNAHLLKILASRVETAIEEIRMPELGHHRIGGSVGTACSAEDGTSAALLLEAADAAMYRRKAQHRRTRPAPPRPHLFIV